MQNSFQVIKNDSFILWIFFVASLLILLVLSESKTDLFSFYVFIDSVVFFILYQIFCIAKATFVLDDKNFSVTGLSNMFSFKERKIIIPLDEITSHYSNSFLYYNKLSIEVVNGRSFNLYFDKWSNKEENYNAFITSLNERLHKIR